MKKLLSAFMVGILLCSLLPMAVAEESDILDMAAQLEKGTYSYKETGDNFSYMLEDVLYCANPADISEENIRKQCMNIFVPKGFMNADGTLNHDAVLNGYTIDTVPIIYLNGVGGYAEALPKTPNGFQWTEALAFIQNNYVLVSPGSRGIETKKTDGTWIGKAPAGIVDLKAGVRFLKYNDSVLPGDSNKIISIGTSAGGAMSMLLGVSGNNEAFLPYLEEIGAVIEDGIGDDVFASQAFCPITDLENADMAYEWNFGANNSWNGSHSAPSSGIMNDFQSALSQVLSSNYISYVNSLNLGVTLDSTRSGSYYDGLMQVLSNSLNSFLDERYGGSASEKAQTYVTSVDEKKKKSDFSTFAVFNDETGKYEITDLDAYVLNYRPRIKMCPAFDHPLYNEAENQLFGNASIKARHFSTADYTALIAQDYSSLTAENITFQDGKETVSGNLGYQEGLIEAYAKSQDEEVQHLVSLMNAMNYITAENAEEKSDFAPYIRIRVGSNDSDTAFTVTYNLALALQAFTDTEVDYAIKWGQSHGNCNDAANVIAWVDAICK